MLRVLDHKGLEDNSLLRAQQRISNSEIRMPKSAIPGKAMAVALGLALADAAPAGYPTDAANAPESFTSGPRRAVAPGLPTATRGHPVAATMCRPASAELEIGVAGLWLP